MNRRDFLRGTTLLVGAAVVGSTTSGCTIREEDVIVVEQLPAIEAIQTSTALELLETHHNVETDTRALSDTDCTTATYVSSINGIAEDPPAGRNGPPGPCWSFAIGYKDENGGDVEADLTVRIDEYLVQAGQKLIARLVIVPLPPLP